MTYTMTGTGTECLGIEDALVTCIMAWVPRLAIPTGRTPDEWPHEGGRVAPLVTRPRRVRVKQRVIARYSRCMPSGLAR